MIPHEAEELPQDAQAAKKQVMNGSGKTIRDTGTVFDRIEIISIFQNYTKDYNEALNDIDRKILHTFRVAKAAEQIGGSVSSYGKESNQACRNFCWFLGILHDIGRFEQERRYGTYVDSISVDHAELGADILFRDGLIDAFPSEGLIEGWREIAEVAVRNHNKLTLPPDLDPRTRFYCTVIRDADKTDIFRVYATIPAKQLVGSIKNLFTDDPIASEAVMACVLEHRCVPRKIVKSKFENQITICCMAFDLELDVTRKLVKEQGYLLQILKSGTDAQREQLEIVRNEIQNAWGFGL